VDAGEDEQVEEFSLIALFPVGLVLEEQRVEKTRYLFAIRFLPPVSTCIVRKMRQLGSCGVSWRLVLEAVPQLEHLAISDAHLLGRNLGGCQELMCLLKVNHRIQHLIMTSLRSTLALT